jgi:co-chaperonin GroES (HSP10)
MELSQTRTVSLLNDLVLVRRIDDGTTGVTLSDTGTTIIKPKRIILPESVQARSIKGKVLAVGPGKWIPGEWWKVRGKWEWFDGFRDNWGLRPGMTVLFNSKWQDFASDYLKKTPTHHDNTLHMIQQADVFAIVNA